jgi:hypothetical protein
MGQQQLLLIILGVIVVGIAVVVGITMFQENAISANRDAVTNDLVNLAARAQQYYRRPVSLGGGGNSFEKMTLGNLAGPVSSKEWKNPNGAYELETDPVTDPALVVINGVGVEKQDNTAIWVSCRVTPDSITTTPGTGAPPFTP